jgi:hypothetical protein
MKNEGRAKDTYSFGEGKVKVKSGLEELKIKN